MTSIFTTISDYQARLDAREAAAMNRLIELWERIEADIVTDLERLITSLEERGEGITESALYRMERYRRLLVQLDDLYAQLAQEGLVEIRRAMVDAAGLGEIMAQAVAAGITGRADSLGRLPIEALTQITALAQPGGPLSQILNDAYPLAADALTKQLISNVGRGKNPRTILAFARKQGLVAGLDHILLVSRDQSVRAFRQASQASYANDLNVIGYKRMAARQTRTCPMCLALDGTLYETDEFMPVHPQDRCTIVPVLRGFPATTWKSGRTWFDEQTPAIQQKMLGPERYRLYKKGTPLTDFVAISHHETWGPSLKLRPLAQMN
jgi:SPP1 gp7 family putative phage head morphogenesis protein